MFQVYDIDEALEAFEYYYNAMKDGIDYTDTIVKGLQERLDQAEDMVSSLEDTNRSLRSELDDLTEELEGVYADLALYQGE